MKSKIILGITGLFIFTGCSMMPYHENFICEGGSNIHICKRVSEVYKESEDGTLYQTQKAIPAVNAKPVATTCGNCKELEDEIEAISYENLKKPEEIVIINHYKVIKENNKTQTKAIPLNKKIKVCVYNANIRALPSCQAKIVGIAHKGEKLYAYYLKGAWIKVKGGWIHKSLVCGECKCEK